MIGTPLQKVVVTGMGLVSCLGHDLQTISDSLRVGRTGIVRDPNRVEMGFRCPLTGQIADFDPKAMLSRKERRAMADQAVYGAVAALRAIEDAGLDRDLLRSPNAGVLMGNDSTCAPAVAAADKARADGHTRSLGSSAVVRTMNSGVTINMSVLLGTQGANWTLAAACASGAHAIGQAAWLVATGQQDIVVCGGVQEVNWESMAAFDAQGTFSGFEGDPALASRPFSHNRDGLVPSGGGCVLILESERHARARDANPRAEILGYSFSSDGHHITTPSGDGARRCMQTVLSNASVLPSEVEYISAHATSTPVGDRIEALAINDVFGDSTPPVSSTKGLTGHECWMSGASEVAYALLMSEGGFLTPNNALEKTDDDLGNVDLIRELRDTKARILLSNSFGFGGTNSCLLLRAER